MKKSTKILSLILSVLTLLSVFSVATPVFATEVTELTSESTENVDDITVSSEETEIEENEEAEIVSEIEDMRTEHTKYFRMSDGSYMAAQYAQPVHYEENGEWKEYDYSITENENADEAEKFVIENSDSEMSFPEEFSEDSAQIEVSAREYDIKFSPVVEKKLFNKNSKGKVKDHKKLKSNEIIEEFTEEAPVDESTDKNAEKLKIDNQKSAIAYEEVYDNIDLEYEISSNQIKESIVLNSKQDKNKFEFTVDTDGLFPKKETDGSITLYEDEECTKPVSSIMKPYMYDANGEFSYDVDMDIKEKKGTYILVVKADNNWLNDKARKYPVVIDPTIVLDVGRAKTYDCYVDNSQASTSFPYDYYIYAGYNSYGKTRTFIKFDLPALPDNCAVIQNASIRFWQNSVDMGDGSAGYLNIYNVTKNWANDRTVTWNAQPTFDSTVIDYCQFKSGAGTEYVFDITKSVKSWYEGSANYGLMLKSANESKAKRTQLFSAENYGVNAYPVIQITYRNNKGLEGYWSYSSYSNDTAGVAYINDYTGNLVYELPILSSISEIMPLTLTAYFNNYCANTKFSAGKSGSSKTTPGKGFRLNVQQTVLPSSQYGLTGTAATTYPFVYTDADGTEHYIQKTTENGSTVYKDEDGLGLTLITKSSGNYKYRITDKSGNKWYFNDQGNLFCQKDNNDNAIRIYFKAAASNFAANQMIDYITDGAGHKFTFDYYKTDAGLYNGYIKTITDNAGRKITFTTTSGLLRKITYSNSTYTNIVYCNESAGTETDEGLIDYVQGFNGYALNFDYTSKATGRQVKTVKEYGRNSSGSNVKGQVVTFDRTAYNKTIVRTAGIDGYHYAEDSTKGSDDIVTTLQFDNYGKTVSQQVSYGSGGEIGASNYGYTSGSSTLGSANKVSSSASLGKNTVNLIYNGNAETTSNWTQKTNDTVTSTKGNSTTCYMGKKSLYIKNTAFTGNGTSYYKQNLSSPTVGKTYTFSAYVRAGALTQVYNTTKKGAYVQLTAYDSSGSSLKTEYSERITAKTDTAVNNGWRRLTVSMTVPTNTTTLSTYLCFKDMTGTVYFDCIQLELGSAANSYNMLENSSFEKQSSNAPTSWSNAGSFTIATNSSGTVLDGSSANGHKDGSRGLRIDGDALKSKGMSQLIAVESDANDTYIVSGWGAAHAVNDTWHNGKSLFEIAVRVTYTRTKTSDGTTATVTQYKNSAKFNTTISGWQYSSTSFALKYTNPASGYTYTPTHILVMPRYCYQENYAYFDHIQLIKDVAQTYTYDNKGNPVSTAANGEQKVNTTYNDNNDLTSYTDTAGYKSTATYDSKHNLLTTKSAKGIVTSNTYDSTTGNLTATEIQNSGNTAAIKTATSYHGANSSAGINAGSYVNVVTDENGKTTTYNCTWESGIPTKTTYANGAVTTYGYNNSIKSRLTSITHEGTKVNYDYVNQSGVLSDRISKITYTGTASGSPSESYSFSYDNYGNVSKTMVGNQALSTNTYAAKNGALTTTTYGNSDKRTYNYNKLGLVSSIVSVNDGTSKTSYSWGYNNAGGTVYHRDAENNLKYLYDYDSLGRLIRQEIQSNDTFSHVGSTEVTYDVRNNVTKVASEFGGFVATDEYMYSSSSGAADAANSAKDNLISRYRIAGSRTVDYSYDSLNRLTQKKLTTTTPIYTNYTYKASDLGGKYTTTMVETEKLDNATYKYYYDNVGNITKIDKNSGAYRSYTYDKKNQLLSEVNSTNGITTNFTYDAIGNITKKVQSGAVSKTINYRYGNDGKTGWNNLLTGVDLSGNGIYESTETISYDAIGNPTTYLGASLSWYGRQLKNYTKGSTSVSYTYDSDGLRGTKIYNGTKSTYHYVSGQLRYETRGNLKFYYFYDASGNLSAIRYYDANGKSYAYFALTNAQGDVVAFYTGAGVCVVTYEYDAWGNVIKTTDTTGINFAELNPIRYRGYYYDTETGLYYLQSRYYNPQVGRFLNSDNITDSGSGILGFNSFVYCANNYVIGSDPTGHGFWKNLGDFLVQNIKATFSLLLLPLKHTTVTVGLGKGVGASFDAKGTSGALGLSAQWSSTTSTSFSSKDFGSTNTVTNGYVVGASIFGISEETYSEGTSHTVGEAGCTCTYGNLFERDTCPANKPFSEVKKAIGISGSLYVGIGGEFSITCDVEKMITESEEILNECKLFSEYF